LNGGDCAEIFHYLGVVIPDSCKWISDFKTQVEAIHQNFFEHPAFADHKAQLIKEVGLNQFNFKGKLVNKVLCEFENILIQHAIHFCSERGIEIGANCFDGLLLKQSESLNDEFIKSMEKYVVEEVGIPVKFVVKEMDEGVNLSGLMTKEEKKQHDKIEKAMAKAQEKFEQQELKKKENLDLSTFQEKLSDEKLAKVFIDNTDSVLYKDVVQNCIYFYNGNNCLYERLESIDHLKTFFTETLDDYFEFIVPGNELEEEFKTKRKLELLNARGQANLLALVKIKIPDSTDFIMDNFNRKNLFPFQDKVIDFSLSKDDEGFIRKRTRQDYFTFTTNNVYKPDYDKNWLMKYVGELLDTKDVEYKMCFFIMLAHGLTNDNTIKLITFWIGEGDNGKSAMMSFYKSILGDFCCPDASKAILEKRGSCLDTEKVILIGKRVATISELQKTDKLDITFVKSYVGNDRDFMLRPKSDSAQIRVVIDPKTFIPTNEMPRISEKESAFLSRIVCFNFCNTFPRSSEKMKEIMSKKDDLFSFLCELASELTAKKFLFTQCPQMMTFTRTIKNSFDSVGGFMDDWMEMTNNPEDFMTARDLHDYYVNYCQIENREPLHIDAFGKALRKQPYNYNSKERKKPKKIRGKTFDCYFFIKKRPLERDEREEAVIIIQALARGYITRKRVWDIEKVEINDEREGVPIM
jgi:phage/plasmid-associated DNA primase